MGLRFRRSVSRGPLRATVSRSGVTPSLRLGPVTVSTKSITLRLGAGLSYSWPLRRRR
jgi:hypothetical protein